MLENIAGQIPADHLMKSIANEVRSKHIDAPTRKQVSVVLHALSDHTAILAALKHRPDPTSPWPEAASIGRWLHDVGDQLDPFPFQ